MQDSAQLKQDSAEPSEDPVCTCPERDDRKFEKPVSWLLGRQLIASLKSTLLYTAFGTKIDARDWMDAKVFPQAPRGPQKNKNGEEVVDPQYDVSEAWRKMYARDNNQAVDFTTEKGEFWFDYISDTGDGMTATYSVAYLCLSDLWIQNLGEKVPEPEPKTIEQTNKDAKEPEDKTVDPRLCVSMKSKNDNLKGLYRLPRGEFLLVGGDTSYHMADYASLHIRFQKPFQWAYEDLRKDLNQDPFADLSEAEKKKEILRFRPLFGIPGNHDYYDMLDGFRRQFREPTRSRSENNYYPDDFEASQLRLPGFRRFQETSYLALRLPFDWMIWGLDTEVGKLDERQRDFFLLVKEKCTPKKLIVCTSAPHTVFGKFANKDDEKSAKAFLQLGLPRPFLRSENPEVPQVDSGKCRPTKPEAQLKDTEIRLDLAGDVHHYARYWGPASEGTQPTRKKSAKAPALARSNYASVMSGLGGAFHHPSTTYVDEIKEQALYPKEGESREHIAGEIFNPWRVVKGGGVWFVGGLVALILAFAAIADDSTRPAIHNFLPFRSIGLTERERYGPTVLSPEEAKKKQEAFKPSVVTSLLAGFGVASNPWTAKPFESECDNTLPVYLWGKCRTEWPTEYTWGFWLVVLTVPVMFTAMLLMRRHYRIWKEREEVDQRARQEQQATVPPSKFDNDAHVRSVNWTIWGFTVGTTLLALIGVLIVMPYRNFITPFGNSLLVLLSMCWAGMAIYLSIKYSDWLFEQASQRQIRRRDWAITWVLTACAFFAVAIGLWVFGKNNPAAYLVADIVSVLVVIAIPVLLLVAAWKLGGAHQKFVGKVGMGVIGFWHAILQIGVAVFLIKKGTWLTVLLSIALVLIFWIIGKKLMNNNKRGWLTFAWVVFGALMLVLPPLTYYLLIEYRPALSPELFAAFFWPHSVNPVLDPVLYPLVPFSRYEWWIEWQGWWQLFPIFLCGVFGAFLSCVWLGWYFGVCLGFNGHNNESGGAARIEKFKQIIRFRLTPETLTGYVIAVRDPQRCGKCLNPEIVDIFHLTREKEVNP